MLDEWLIVHKDFFMASRGAAIIDGDGGSAALGLADKMHSLGYRVCVLCDNDRPDDAKLKKKLLEQGISIFECQEGRCIEKELIPLFTRDIINELMQEVPEKNKDSLWNDLVREGLATSKYMLKESLSADDKMNIALICCDKSIFKYIDGGELLGRILFKYFSHINEDEYEKKVLFSLIEWIEK